MEEKELTCIECPMGCTISVKVEGGIVIEIKGNGCPRGRAYAEAEVIRPVRVLTTTVKHESGKMLPVKTDKPIDKNNLLKAVSSIKNITAKGEIEIGDIIVKDFIDGANLIATENLKTK